MNERSKAWLMLRWVRGQRVGGGSSGSKGSSGGNSSSGCSSTANGSSRPRQQIAAAGSSHVGPAAVAAGTGKQAAAAAAAAAAGARGRRRPRLTSTSCTESKIRKYSRGLLRAAGAGDSRRVGGRQDAQPPALHSSPSWQKACTRVASQACSQRGTARRAPAPRSAHSPVVRGVVLARLVARLAEAGLAEEDVAALHHLRRCSGRGTGALPRPD